MLEKYGLQRKPSGFLPLYREMRQNQIRVRVKGILGNLDAAAGDLAKLIPSDKLTVYPHTRRILVKGDYYNAINTLYNRHFPFEKDGASTFEKDGSPPFEKASSIPDTMTLETSPEGVSINSTSMPEHGSNIKSDL